LSEAFFSFLFFLKKKKSPDKDKRDPLRCRQSPHNNTVIMSNLTPEWAAMSKLVSQFYAKADAGK
jgi:hypothetical protein